MPTWSITIVTIAIILSNSLPKSNLLVGESTFTSHHNVANMGLSYFRRILDEKTGLASKKRETKQKFKL